MQVNCRRKSTFHKSLQAILKNELIAIRTEKKPPSPGGTIASNPNIFQRVREVCDLPYCGIGKRDRHAFCASVLTQLGSIRENIFAKFCAFGPDVVARDF
jgi:hypothetical protein